MQAASWHDFVQFDEDGNYVARNRYDWDAVLGIQHVDAMPSLSELESHANGPTYNGSLNNEDGGDVIEVNLTAGQTYTWTLRGVGNTPIVDAYLRLYGIDGTTLIAGDDDGGLGSSSQITFTATTSGIYKLNASSWYQVDPTAPNYQDNGDYAIVQWSPQAGHDAGNSIATAGSVAIGTNYEYFEVAGDSDYYAISLTAGQYYTFTFNGGVAAGIGDVANPPGESIGVLGLYDAAGNNLTGLRVSSGGETTISFFAQNTGTYYLRADPYSNFTAGTPANQTGGYTLDIEQIDLSTRDPLEAFIWDNANNVTPDAIVNGVPTVYIYFGNAGENFGTGEVTYGWRADQIAAVMHALENSYKPLTGFNYVITNDSSLATFKMITVENQTYGARFYPQDPAYGALQGIGSFNRLSGGFQSDPGSILPGGYSYAVILHEFGHAHGIAHPHDRGGGSEIMLGVTASTGSLGVFNLNQGVYSVMSYNDGWDLHPSGDRNYSVANRRSGWSESLGAFDIATMQARGYLTQPTNSGNTVYTLADLQADASYQTILDTGGIDTIQYVGTKNSQIDLLAATLDYTATGGGAISFVYNVWGGYTIANGVTIENATGGSGDDVLLGNSADNTLTGGDGNDNLFGRTGNDTLNGDGGHDVLNGDEGNDTLNGGVGNDVLRGGAGNDRIIAGAGTDKVYGGDGLDVVTLGAENDVFVAEFGTTKSTLKTGSMSIDIITDFDGAGDDLIDLRELGQTMTFKGTNANKNVGDLTYKTYTSLNGAENALGFDIDGQPGASGVSGPVTVVYGNKDGGAADFAIILLNTSSVDASDFLFG